MKITGRSVVVSVAVLSVLGLSACASKDTKSEPASSTQSSAASATTNPAGTTTSAPAATTSGAATTTSPAAKPAGDKVASADLPAIVSDRTFSGDDEGKSYSEYYAPDGTLRGKSGTETYSGSWKVVGEQLCFTYPNKGDKTDSETDCYAVFKNGDAISWVDEDGKLVEATFAEGNPNGL